MNWLVAAIALLGSTMLGVGQSASAPTPHNITPAQLQSILALPLSQAVQQREQYKQPLREAYNRQLASEDKDCATVDGQQPYNICMGKANEQADADFAVFYNNLQMLCHDQDQLLTLQASQRVWQGYRDSEMQATHAAWPNGTGASGFAGEVYLGLLRDRMKELHRVYGLNIAQ